MLEFIEGDIKSWGKTGGPGGSDHFGKNRLKVIFATYDIETSSQIYHASLEFVRIKSSEPDEVGLSSFCIINSKNWKEDYNYWGEQKPGITID